MTELRDFLDAVEVKNLPPLPGKEGEGGGSGKIFVGTIHRAKGLEWDHVFLAHLNDGFLPCLRSDDNLGCTVEAGLSLCRDDEERMAEERRLFHVGITRARVSCTATVSVSEEPSRFLEDLPSTCLRVVELDEFQCRQEAGLAAKGFVWRKEEAGKVERDELRRRRGKAEKATMATALVHGDVEASADRRGQGARAGRACAGSHASCVLRLPMFFA